MELAIDMAANPIERWNRTAAGFPWWAILNRPALLRRANRPAEQMAATMAPLILLDIVQGGLYTAALDNKCGPKGMEHGNADHHQS